MSCPRPSILTALVWAYWDLYYVLRTNWRIALVAMGILSVGAIATLAAPRLLTYDPIGQAVVRLLILIGLCFLLTPFFVATHRLVLLGEQATGYGLKPYVQRFQLFFGWLSVMAIIVSVPSFLSMLATPNGPVYYLKERPAEMNSSTITILASFAAFIVMQRLLVLFPAIALDAPGAIWQNAVKDSGVHLWFSFAVLILPFIPLRLLSIGAAALFRLLPSKTIMLIASTLWLGTGLLVIATLGCVIASRLYQLSGDRLNAPLPHS